MEADRAIPSQFVFPSPAADLGSAELEPQNDFYKASSSPAAVATTTAGGAAGAAGGADRAPQTREFVYPPTVEMGPPPAPVSSSFDMGGPWAEKRIVVGPSSSERMQIYGRVPPKTWAESAREWLGNVMESLQTRQQQQQQQQEQQQQQHQQYQRVFYALGQPRSSFEGLVADVPPQLIYKNVVYVPHSIERPPQLLGLSPYPSPYIAVPAAAPPPPPPPPPFLIPLESEIICRGHPSDRTELCFGCTIPPRQLKFDIVREELRGCFGICRSHRFKAVCRKCRAAMPTCNQCGKQSVIRHP